MENFKDFWCEEFDIRTYRGLTLKDFSEMVLAPYIVAEGKWSVPLFEKEFYLGALDVSYREPTLIGLFGEEERDNEILKASCTSLSGAVAKLLTESYTNMIKRKYPFDFFYKEDEEVLCACGEETRVNEMIERWLMWITTDQGLADKIKDLTEPYEEFSFLIEEESKDGSVLFIDVIGPKLAEKIRMDDSFVKTLRIARQPVEIVEGIRNELLSDMRDFFYKLDEELFY